MSILSANEILAFKVTPLNLYNEHELILIGKIISVTPISPFATQYDVKVEQYLKNPKPYDLITVRGGGVKGSNYQNPPTDTIFDEGSRVLLYLNKQNDWYMISGYSFNAPSDCDSHQLLGLATFPGEPLARGHPVEEFEADKHCISPRMAVPSESFTISSPLKQFRSGIAPEDVRCNDDLQLVFKAKNGNPICVTPETGTKLFKRGWITYSAEVPESFVPQFPKDLALRIIGNAPCAWMKLDRIPHDELIKKHDRLGAAAKTLHVGDDQLKQVPHLQEMINAMKTASGFHPSQYEKNTVEKEIASSEAEQQKIWTWLEETYNSEYGKEPDRSFTSYFEYNKNFYQIVWSLC